MPSPSKKKPSKASRPAPKKPSAAKSRAPPARKATKPARPSKLAKSAPSKPAKAPAATVEAPPVEPPRFGDGRRHLLSLSFLRDGDEFLARLETDAGQITELKNRSLDQLLSLVAGELEDLLQ